jgi:probable rRNA maturation factor
VKIKLAIQNASTSTRVPAKADVKRWAAAALEGRRKQARLSLRIVDEAESAELNRRYRGQAGPTNVLSFPFEPPPDLPLLGDLAICAPVVEREAVAQGKALDAHWAHLIVHGILHLLGHDHLNEVEAQAMEAMETLILDRLGLPPPY